jgi:autotransporter-associated beta strand protein
MSRKSLGVSALLCLLSAPVFAATHVWSGAVNDQFSNPANWYGGSPAGDVNADLSFPGGARPAARNDLANLNVRSIAFSGTDYSITGNAIRFGQNAEIIDSSHGLNTLGCDLVLSSDLSITTFPWDWPIKPILTLSGSISGAGGVQVTGGGGVVFGGSGANTYTGLTRVLAGELQLKKPARTTAVSGELRVESGFVSTFADEQISDAAPVTVRGRLGVGARETIGPLTVYRQATVQTSSKIDDITPWPGTLVLGGDVNVDGDWDIDAALLGRIVLPATRSITLTAGYYGLRIETLSAELPGAGLVINAPSYNTDAAGPRVRITGNYDGPTTVEGGYVQLTNASSAVTLHSGAFGGTSASFTATAGAVKAGAYDYGILATSDVSLASAVVVNLDFFNSSPPRIQLNGSLHLSDAQLLLGGQVDRTLGNVYTIITNESSSAVVGTFHGLPEGSIIGDRWRISYVGGNGNDVTLTEAGHLISTTKLSFSPVRVTVGEPVPIHLQVSTDSPSVTATGAVNVSDGFSIIATVPLVNGAADVSPTFLRGNYLITAAYTGTTNIQPSQASSSLIVEERIPVITSVEPTTVPGGTTTELTVHGSNFVDGSAMPGYPTSFVSSNELRVAFTPASLTEDVQWPIVVQQPGPGPVQSPQFQITVTAPPHDPPVPTLLVFGPQSVTAPVTPGATTAWLSVTRASGSFGALTTASKVVSDDDQDGSVVWQLTKPTPPKGTFTLMDLSARKILAGKPDSADSPPPLPFPPKMFLRNPDGNYSHIELTSNGTWSFLWARPGVGVWTLSSVGDGYTVDLDKTTNGLFEMETSSLIPYGTSPPPPAGVEPGDLFVGIDTANFTWFGDKVDDHLVESAGAGNVSFAQHFGASVSEEAGIAHILLLRRDGTDGAVSVQFATADQTAHAGERYVAQAGTVTFGAGEIIKSIDIPLIDDHSYSGNETFQITISNPAGTTIGVPSSLVATIVDGDPTPVLSAAPSQSSVQEGDSGTVTVPVTFTLTGATNRQVTANWAYIESGSYYVNGQLIFNPGETQKTFNVSYKANTSPEPNRTITISFGYVVGAIGGASQSITIIDDDFAVVSVTDTSVSESAGTVTVRLHESQYSSRPVSVTYATSNGSAVAGSDYTAKSGTITFDQSEKTISIPILNDTIAEGPKSFVLSLTGIQNGHIGRSTAVISIVDDDTPTSSIPAGLSATATGTAAVSVTWFPVANATYDVYRSTSVASPFTPLMATPLTSFNDTTVAPGTTYLYEVRAISGGVPSAFSAFDAATTVAFTDDPLTAGITSAKAVHLSELRTAVTAMRTAAGMASSFGGAQPMGAIIRAVDISQLRAGLDEARTALQLPPLQYTDPVLTSGTTSIKAAHIQQLRDGCR